VNTIGCSACRDGSHIEDEVPYLSIKDISGTPIQVSTVVWISIDQTKSRKVRSRFQYRDIVWVADELSVVIVYDRRRNQVCSSGKVDYSGRGGG
jgi:hypothetical protein